MKTWNGLSREKIIELVKENLDGFNYAQLQSGIDRFELIQILEEEEFESCGHCGRWVPEDSMYYDYFFFRVCEDCAKIDIDENEMIDFSWT